MAGGQQIDSATGTLGDARVVPLRSRKTGTGAATFQLTGIASAVGQGVLRQATAVLGQAITSAQQSMSASGLWWSSTPSVSIQEGSTTAVNVGSSVAGYNSFTDEFRVTPGYALPLWLALTAGPGTGSGNLTPNGTQVDANDISSSPGIKIDVRRSGGAWVSSPAFGITVTAAPATFGSIADLAFEGRFTTTSWTDPQMGVTGTFWTGKHTAWRANTNDGKIYGFGGDGIYPGSNTSLQDGTVHFPRYTLDADKQPTFDIYYPWMGRAGFDFPIAADDHSFIWDSSRGCFWCIGGYSGGPLLGTTYPGQTIVGNQVRAQERLWRFFPAAGSSGEWESLGLLSTLWPNAANLYGQRGDYASVLDHLVFVRPDGGGNARVQYYNCATGAVGFKSSSFPVGNTTDNPQLYDSVNNELIFLAYSGPNVGVHAIKLTNLLTAGTLTVRTLISTSNFLTGQTPMWIRNRRLYVSVQPFYSSQWGTLVGGYGTWSDNGQGLGVYEVTLDTPTPVVSKCGVPNARNYVNNSGTVKRAANEGAYSSADDAVLLSCVQGEDAIQVYRYSPPSWTPAQGSVKALTTDWTGSSSFNTFFSIYEGNSTQMGIRPTAWMSGAFCRDMGMNGAYLCQGGGDQDSFDNSIRAFCFDSRRWYRLSNRATNFLGTEDSGTRAIDYNRDPSDPFYFNATLCEHGPAVADANLVQGGTNWGLFPINSTTGAQATQPGVPHMYDGAVWVPGSWMGNQRGAFVRPESKFVYGGSAQTRRAHYFDLDKLKWGRLSTTNIGTDSYLPVSAINDTDGIIYYTYGFLNLTTKAQTSKSWFNGGSPPSDCAMEYDPVRKLLVFPKGSGSGALSATPVTNPNSPGAMQQLSTVAGNSGGLWTATSQWSGIAYCSWLDCFFYYNSRAEGGQFIWKIQPPSTVQATALTGQWTCTKITMGGDTVVAGTQLTYGNLFAIPKLKCMGICIPNGYMYIFRPSES